MAPSRRKGADKAAAAAAAARRKWKVGDLVLAKVKGFPAWPATVSEPEKWGYPPDWKKVMVHFFGTDQIAFCNPIDIEDFTEEKKVSLLGKRHGKGSDFVRAVNEGAGVLLGVERVSDRCVWFSAFCNPIDIEDFTEEKKVSLLGKRHGKGSDFVRAVNEIIDCFEKLKTLDQVSSVNGTEETSITNENNSEESLTNPIKKDTAIIAVNLQNDLLSLTEAAVAAAARDALHDEEIQLEETRLNLAYSGTPACITYSTRSKIKSSQSRKSGANAKVSARRLRSSSRIEGSRSQKLLLHPMSNTRSSRQSTIDASHDRSLRISKRITKSSDDSESHRVDSSASLSSDSIEENDSAIMTVDSDAHSFNDGSFNDGSTVDSGCKLVGVEAFTEKNDGEAELSDRLDFQSNAAVIKKKRKLNRKRHHDDNIVSCKLDEVISEAEVLKDECVSPDNKKLLIEGYTHDNGDEHLPLVKRARVRMSRVAQDDDDFVCKEEKSVVGSESAAGSSSEPLNCELDAPADRDPNKGDPANSSLANGKPQFWHSRKMFADGEAALPPSKRLHRALEAMTANVAEDSDQASKCSPIQNTQSNGYSSLVVNSSEMSIGNTAVTNSGSGQNEENSHCNSLSTASVGCVGADVESTQDDEKTCNVDVLNTGSNTEVCNHSLEHEEFAITEGLHASMLDENPAENVAQHEAMKMDSPNTGEELANSNCNKPGSLLPPPACGRIGFSELEEATGGHDLHISGIKSDPILVAEISGGSPKINIDDQIEGANVEDDETHKNHLSPAENNQDSQRSLEIEEDKSASMDSVRIPPMTPLTILTDESHCSLLDGSAISNDHQEGRAVPVTQLSSSPTEGPELVARASPPSSSICNASGSANNTSLENSSSRSSDVQLHLEKAKLIGKLNSKPESLLSFETVIRSLTRTKESIGRATRIAIDCAKLGFATKVMEMLAHNLESESSLHKKVDLFFLVDSIAQCSRGMKGDCGVYPSAIQAMLPRLLLAAAPPGSSSYENHRQCLKVWQERKILPEPMIRRHIRELDALFVPYPTGCSRRPLRNERAFDDPIREMEGMLVDEYGSNSSFQLPGFSMPPMLKDDDGGSNSDGESFEAVTPEHNVENIDCERGSICQEKRSHILEDVDGELEMEDVAPCCENETASNSYVAGTDMAQMAENQADNHYGSSFEPQQHKDVPLKSAPSSMLPPPLPPPPPSLPPPPSHSLPPAAVHPEVHDSVSNGPESKLYSSSQNFNNIVRDPNVKHSVSQRVKSTSLDSAHHRFYNSKDLESQGPRHRFDSSIDSSFRDRSTYHISGRSSNHIQQPDGAFCKGFHVRPPHPSPSSQFSYVQEQRCQSRREIPPPSQSNRFHNRNENGNFYRDRGCNKFVPRDNIGECWRPPLPSISGPGYNDGARMANETVPYGGPPREPPYPNNRWNCPPRPINHRHFSQYRPPSEGSIPVGNRGPNYWRPR